MRVLDAEFVKNFIRGKRWMGAGMAREKWRKPFLSYPAGRSGSRKGRF